MFINVSENSSSTWSKEQLDAAKELSGDGKVIDYLFYIDPSISSWEVNDDAFLYLQSILECREKIGAVHVMGEMTFVYSLVYFLQRHGLKAVASTTIQETVENPDSSKTTQCKFVQFREYSEGR